MNCKKCNKPASEHGLHMEDLHTFVRDEKEETFSPTDLWKEHRGEGYE